MAKKPPIRVALDLETTGLHAEQDAILEVAAIKFQGNELLDIFETFVAPGRSIPYRVQRLTGIKPELITGAPHFDTIAKRLQSFLGDFPIVGHSIPFDVGFLRRRGLARTKGRLAFLGKRRGDTTAGRRRQTLRILQGNARRYGTKDAA